MKLSRSIGYAFTALGYLARQNKVQPIMAKEIAKNQQVPLEYLLKILQQLAKAGVLQSIRGPQGGFLLNHDAEKISVLDVVEALEGPFAANSPQPPKVSHLSIYTKLNQCFGQASQQAAKILAKTSLADLIR